MGLLVGYVEAVIEGGYTPSTPASTFGRTIWPLPKK